uniref:Ribosome biogenesis protein n=1 Tax=Panagrellus redivivus TaxID=6233 RepID=A0A7E4USP7_PANRE
MSPQQMKSKIKSIDFSTLPYSFQCRLTDLTPPKILFNLRHTGHTICKLTSRRGHFARILIVTTWNQLARQNHITSLENNKIYGFRSLTLVEALKCKHLYVRNHLVLSLTTQQSKLLKPSLVPIYGNIVFMCGPTMSDVIKFLHPRLIGFQLSDPNILTTRQAMNQFVQTVLKFTHTRKRAIIIAYSNVISPQFYHELKTIVESERPSYRVVLKGEVVTVKHKSLMKLNV